MAKNTQENSVPTVLEHDLMDQIIFDSVSEFPKVGELIDDEKPNHRPLVQDVFGSLYKLSPTVQEEPNSALKPLIDNLMKMPEHVELRNSTKLNDIASAMGTMQLAPELLKQLEEIEKQKPQEQTNQQYMDQMSETQKSQMRQKVRAAIEKAQDEADQVEDCMSGWGIKPSELQDYPFEKKFELAETLLRSNKLKRVTDLMGRFRQILKGLDAVKYTHGSDEIVDITTGNDLARLLPNELLKLQVTPLLFFKDYTENNLLQYEMKGVEPQGKGPIIVCLDVSPSMQEGMGDASREEWAKAMTLALIALAEKQKRAFALVTFAERVINSEFFAGPVSIEKKMKIAATATKGGGTDYMCALDNAFGMRQKHVELKPADLVFITDGEYGFRPEDLEKVLAAKKSLEVRVFGIGVGSEGSQSLEKFCDQVCQVTSDGDIQSVQQVLKATAEEA